MPAPRPPLGTYVCWTSGSPVPIGLFNFRLRRSTYHVIVRGSVDGRWRYNRNNKVVTFISGTLADAPYEGLYVPGTDPGRRGSETIFLRHPADNRGPDTAAHPPCYLSQ